MSQQSMIDLSHDQVQALIATSTGSVDTYLIPVYGAPAMLLPQNIVLSAMNVAPDTQTVEWHEHHLPTYVVHQPDIEQATALVIEGDNEATRFALVCDHMPKALRLRISEVVDAEKATPAEVYQYVNINGEEYQIPDLSYIQSQLFKS